MGMTLVELTSKYENVERKELTKKWTSEGLISLRSCQYKFYYKNKIRTYYVTAKNQ